MKVLITQICIIVFTCYYAGAQTHQVYKVFHSKYKHGKAQEALDIGMRTFLPAHQMNGVNVQVYQYVSGPWDAQIMIPIDGTKELNSLFSSARKVIYQSMVDLAGGEPELSNLIRRYNELVVTEQTDFVRLFSDPLQGVWYLTENKQGTTSLLDPYQKKIFENGHFAFIYKPEENHSWSMLGDYYVNANLLVETSTYTSDGKNIGITVTWKYQIKEDGSLLVEGPVKAIDSEGNDVLSSTYDGGNGRLVWQREIE